MNFDYDEAFKTEQVKHECEKHGAVDCTLFVNMGRTKTYCPICSDEADKAEKQQARNDAMKVRLANCGVPVLFSQKKYKDFQTDGDGKKNKAMSIIKEYADSFGDRLLSGDNLILAGGVGTGKTHLASCLVKQLVYQENAVEMDTMAGIIRKIRATWSDKYLHEETLYSRYENIDLLVIDEIGVGKGSEDERNIAYEIIGRRYNAMKPTVILSNCNIEKMADFIGERCVDRLLEKGRVIAFNWESHRRRASL